MCSDGIGNRPGTFEYASSAGREGGEFGSEVAVVLVGLVAAEREPTYVRRGRRPGLRS